MNGRRDESLSRKDVKLIDWLLSVKRYKLGAYPHPWQLDWFFDFIFVRNVCQVFSDFRNKLSSRLIINLCPRSFEFQLIMTFGSYSFMPLKYLRALSEASIDLNYA